MKSSADDSRAIARQRKRSPRPREGDAFSLHLRTGGFLLGRVIGYPTTVGFSAPTALIYIYRQAHAAVPKALTPALPSQLLLPPIQANNSLWSYGFAVAYDSRPILPEERLSTHSFRDDDVVPERFYDEFANPQVDPREPIGVWASTSALYIDAWLCEELSI